MKCSRSPGSTISEAVICRSVLVRASRQVAIYSPARLRCSSCNSSMLSRDLP